MRNIKIPLIAITLSVLFGCAPKVYFTSQLRKDIEAANISLTKIQFYNDKEVTLKRELESGQKANVESGKVVFEDGKYIHYIKLKKNTPGICKEVFTDKIAVAFEEGSGRTLTFGENPHNTYSSGFYQIYALEWKEAYSWTSASKIGRINYDNKEYYIQPEGSNARLKVMKNFLSKIEIETRKMKGLKVD